MYALQRHDDAIAAWEKSIELSPCASRDLGFHTLLLRPGAQRPMPCVPAWPAWLSQLPLTRHAQHNNLATAVMLRKPPVPERALSHFREAIKLSPSDGQIRFNLAAVLEATGRLQGASRSRLPSARAGLQEPAAVTDSLEEYKLAKELGIERADQNIRNVRPGRMRPATVVLTTSHRSGPSSCASASMPRRVRRARRPSHEAGRGARVRLVVREEQDPISTVDRARTLDRPRCTSIASARPGFDRQHVRDALAARPIAALTL